MPRILLSSAHIVPFVLESIGFQQVLPHLAASYPDLPQPFHATAERIERLQNTDITALLQGFKQRCESSAKKPFCDAGRVYAPLYSNDRM